MNNLLQAAIALRQQGEYEKSRQALKGSVCLHIAWVYDNEGEERQAEQWYRAAMREALCDEDKFDALFGLASTLRCLGSYPQAKTVFEEILATWPAATEVQPFYALCLHNMGKHEKAVTTLLEYIARYPTERALPYKKALHYYAQHPRQRW